MAYTKGMKNVSKIIFISLLIGFINSIIFVIFEFIVNEGTEFIWTQIFNTNLYRITVIPIAILLGILYSVTIKQFKQKQIGNPEINLFETQKTRPVKILDLVTVFVIGAVSLLAGASLGPEASLSAIALGLGAFFGLNFIKNKNIAMLLSFASLGALLVAFFGSLIPILVPILVIYKKQKKLELLPFLVVIITGVSAYGTLVLIKDSATGYGTIPVSSTINLTDIFYAFLLGLLGTSVSYLLKWLITKFTVVTVKINKQMSWIATGAIVGGILGAIYLIGGPDVQFSGKEGTTMLLESAPSLTILSLVIMIFAKLLATSWSLASGYRGGLVFPTIFMGVAISLIFELIHPALAGSGIMIGSIIGIMSMLLTPLIGFILVMSMVPLKLVVVAIAGLLGALIGSKAITKING